MKSTARLHRVDF